MNLEFEDGMLTVWTCTTHIPDEGEIFTSVFATGESARQSVWADMEEQVKEVEGYSDTVVEWPSVTMTDDSIYVAWSRGEYSHYQKVKVNG